MRRTLLIIGLVLLVCEALFASAAGFPQVPFYFEQNQGQAHPRIRFIARGSGSTAYLLDQGAVLRVGRRPVTLHLDHSNRVPAQPSGLLAGTSSYFTGPAAEWHTGVAHYARVSYRGVYPGIDLHYYSAGGRMEFDLVVAAGADPAAIRLRYDGAATPRVDRDGGLRLTAGQASMVQHRPRAYQDGPEGRREVAAQYRVGADGTVSFDLGAYDHGRPLTIDPVLSYGTYLGGNGYEQVSAIRVDGKGAVYIAGSVATPASDANPWTTAPAAAQQVAVLKLQPATNELVYFVRLGGSNYDTARSLVLDSDGGAIIVGRTASDAFPRVYAIQSSRTTPKGAYTGFVTKVARDGRSLVYSTYLGGSGLDDVLSVALDPDGMVLVAGNTTSPDFPQRNAIQPVFTGTRSTMAFVSRLSADGRSLQYSTFYGGTGYTSASRVVVDSAGSIYLAGTTGAADFPLRNSAQKKPGMMSAFAARLAPDGQSMVYSVLLGGTGTTVAQAATVEGSGALYVAGNTTSRDLATYNALQTRSPAGAGTATGFIVKLGANGVTLFSTYLGGSKGESVQDLALDSLGSLYAAGWTRSSDFPVQNPMQSYTPGGADGADAFVSRISPSGQQLLFSTLLGGRGDDYATAVALVPSGEVYLAGYTTSLDFPLRNAYQTVPGGNTDMFLACLATDDAAAATPSFALSPALVAFTAVTGSPQPSPQTVQISSDAAQSLSFNYAASSLDHSTWLSAKAAGRAAFAVAVDPSGLSPGRFGGTVRVSPSDGSTPLDLPVSLTVLSTAPIVTAVDPSTIPVATSDVMVSIYGSGFDATAVASLSLLSSSQYPIATTFVTPNLLRAIIPAAVLSQSLTLTLTVSNTGSATSGAVTIPVGRTGPQINSHAIYGPGGEAVTIAPGEALTLHGLNLGPANPAFFTVQDTGTVGTVLGGTRVLFDGQPAPVLFASSTKVSLVAPFNIGDRQQVALQVEYQGTASDPVLLQVAPSVPGIFTSDLLGLGQAFVTNDDGTQNGPNRPAANGSVIAVWASGGGLFQQAVVDGQVLADALELALPVSATIDGTPCEVLYAGAAPGMVAGILQINVRVPASVRSGSSDILIRIGDAVSQSGVTVEVR